jgi:hypothetical protein
MLQQPLRVDSILAVPVAIEQYDAILMWMHFMIYHRAYDVIK